MQNESKNLAFSILLIAVLLISSLNLVLSLTVTEAEIATSIVETNVCEEAGICEGVIVPSILDQGNTVVITSYHFAEITFPLSEDGASDYYTEDEQQALIDIVKGSSTLEASKSGFAIISADFSKPDGQGFGGIEHLQMTTHLIHLGGGPSEGYQIDIKVLPDGSFEAIHGAGPGYRG